MGNWIDEQELRKLNGAKKSPAFSSAQREAVERVDSVLVMKGARPATRSRFALKAKRLALFLGKPFEEARREDLAKFFTEVAGTHSPEGVRFVKSFVRRFYTMLLSPYEEEVPEVVSWIRTTKPRASHRKPPAIVRPEEVRRMLEVARNERDRAILSVLYESGARVSELCGLSIGDVEFDQYGARITVDGKTGVRRVRLIHSAVDLRNWLNLHPARSDPQAPLFVSHHPKTSLKPLLQTGVRAVLQYMARLARIEKPANPHAFRKARATELAQRLTPSELSVYHGWVQGSSMPRVYIHLAGDDVEKKLLQQAGVLQDENPAPNPLVPRKCGRCSEENSATAEYCSKCALPLDEEKLRELTKEYDSLRERIPALMDLLREPDVARLLAKRSRTIPIRN